MRKLPFEDEIKLCEELVEYLDKKVKSHETFMKFTQRASLPSASTTSEGVSNSITSDGKVLKLLSRNEEEEVLTYGKKKEKKDTKVKKPAKSAMALTGSGSLSTTGDSSLVHEAEVLEKFKFLNLPSGAPTSFGEAISNCIEEIEAKKTFYQGQERGAVGVATFAEFKNKKEKVETAPVDANETQKKKQPASVFTLDQLQSTEVFPGLGSAVASDAK